MSAPLDPRAAREVHRMTRKLRAATGRVKPPTLGCGGGGCWGQKRVYLGQALGPSYQDCAKANRIGSKLCGSHKHLAGDLPEEERGPLDVAWLAEQEGR